MVIVCIRPEEENQDDHQGKSTGGSARKMDHATGSKKVKVTLLNSFSVQSKADSLVVSQTPSFAPAVESVLSLMGLHRQCLH